MDSALGSTAKQFTEGCHRAVHPVRTLEAVAPFLTQAGITRVADVTGLDYLGVPTTMVTRPNARSLSVTQGKGLTLEAAKASGVMEAIEHFHAESPSLPLRLARRRELGPKACDVEQLPRLGPLLDSDIRILWAAARRLGTDEEQWVPYEMVHLDLTLPLPEGTGYFPLSSNGLASGNTLEEATVHALLELIERDARSLHFLASAEERDARRLDLDTVEDERCLELVTRFRAAGLLSTAWDLTTDLGVATVLVGVMDREDNAFRRTPLAYGSGAHLDRNVALSRALTEAAQTRLTNIVGARDDTLPEALAFARSSERQQKYRAELAPNLPRPRSFQDLPHVMLADFHQDLSHLQRQLQALGMDCVLRVDLSREDWPIHVVRVLVPGLEGHIDVPGYVPGRRGAARLERA